MQALDSSPTGVAKPGGPGWVWEAPAQATAAVLELTGSEQPELLEFQAHTLLNSTMGFALRKLAAALDVPPEKVGPTIERACVHLDHLETLRKARWQPAKVLENPNLAALLAVCEARRNRVAQPLEAAARLSHQPRPRLLRFAAGIAPGREYGPETPDGRVREARAPRREAGEVPWV